MENSKKRKRIRKPCRLPGWILRIKGKLDARHGPPVVNSYIKRLLHRLSSFENQEVLWTEDEMHSTRDSAARSLSGMKSGKESLSSASDASSGSTARDVRASRRASAEQASLRSSISAAKTTVVSANELIIDSNTRVEERIKKMREKTLEKLMFYLQGVRRKLVDFDYDFSPIENGALEIYMSNHRELDDAIRRTAYSLIDKEG
ncbi:MAG: hypothetical protein IKI64_08840 [Clostridia bacterium]|nr:hypothetical protein [Clostridia bacterium]